MIIPSFKSGDEVFCDGLAWGCGIVVEVTGPSTMRVNFGRAGIRPITVSSYWRLATLEDKKRSLSPEPKPEPICEPEQATLENIESVALNWEYAVDAIEADSDCSEEYTHYLIERWRLHGVLNGFAFHDLEVPDSIKYRVEVADRRFVELTFEIEHHVWGTPDIYDQNAFWYYYRWPVKWLANTEGQSDYYALGQ
ncbi:MAG: hypothetical protein PHQ60_05905 [Sideroxydans sp.]|nr:hypothetical protein [Sideroxydans sp.]